MGETTDRLSGIGQSLVEPKQDSTSRLLNSIQLALFILEGSGPAERSRVVLG